MLRRCYTAGMDGRTVCIDGARVRELRLAALLSQRMVSTAAAVWPETLSRIERGKQPRVYLATLHSLAAALNVEPRALLKESNDA